MMSGIEAALDIVLNPVSVAESMFFNELHHTFGLKPDNTKYVNSKKLNELTQIISKIKRYFSQISGKICSYSSFKIKPKIKIGIIGIMNLFRIK